jgi:hypothetical protein
VRIRIGLADASTPDVLAQAVRRPRAKSQPARPSSPEPNGTIEEGSGTAATGPLSTKDTLSRPLLLSLDGSPLRNRSVVEALVAVNVVANICHACVVVQVVQLLVKAPNDVAFSDTSTVLVTPKPVLGLSTLPTQNVTWRQREREPNQRHVPKGT